MRHGDSRQLLVVDTQFPCRLASYSANLACDGGQARSSAFPGTHLASNPCPPPPQMGIALLVVELDRKNKEDAAKKEKEQEEKEQIRELHERHLHTEKVGWPLMAADGNGCWQWLLGGDVLLLQLLRLLLMAVDCCCRAAFAQELPRCISPLRPCRSCGSSCARCPSSCTAWTSGLTTWSRSWGGAAAGCPAGDDAAAAGGYDAPCWCGSWSLLLALPRSAAAGCSLNPWIRFSASLIATPTILAQAVGSIGVCLSPLPTPALMPPAPCYALMLPHLLMIETLYLFLSTAPCLPLCTNDTLFQAHFTIPVLHFFSPVNCCP